jgi:phospholipid-binding lipoprotein MlaA
VLDDLERSSLDYYAAIRSLYRQRRTDDINNGIDAGPTPSFSELPDFTAPTTVADTGK